MYQKTPVQNCLPIQNAWYTGTLVQKMLVPGAAGLHSAVSPEKTLVHEGAASTTRRHDCPGLKEKTAMVSLKLQKRLAASILNCGARKIWMDPNEVSDDLVDPLNDYHVMHTPC